MNEKIKELIAPYLENKRFDSYGDRYDCEMYQFDAEEMEEIIKEIIKECAEFARQYNLSKADRSYNIRKAIIEHF